MKKTLIRKETVSRQVAQLLEKSIIRGDISPEAKLRSTRELADSFSVSQQVIKSAIEILDRKGLVIRKPRSGIYISRNAYDPQRKRILCLSVGGSPFAADYLGKFLCVEDNQKNRHTDFIVKTIAKENFNDLTLKQELHDIAEGHYDCVVVNIDLCREQVAAFLELTVPVVFVGDFAVEGYPDLEYNQIVEDTAERAESAVMAAFNAGAKRIVAFNSYWDHYYNKMYRDRCFCLAKKYGFEFEAIEYVNRSGDLLVEIEARKESVKKNFDILSWADGIIFDGTKKIAWFAQAFSCNNLDFPGEKTIVADEDIYPGCIYLERDFSEFAGVVMERIYEIIENPQIHKRLVLRDLIKSRIVNVS